MTIVVVLAGAGLLLVPLVVWAGHRILISPGARSGGASDALGNFIDVFDPSRARADRDLESQKHMGEVLPSPDDEDHPVWKIDLRHNLVRIPRQR